MEIIRLRAAYPYPDRSVEELKVLAEIWMEDFEFMDDETFRGAIRDHRRKSQFWPTVADIMENAPFVEARTAGIEMHRRRALTDEEIEKNLKQIKLLTDGIFKDVPDIHERKHSAIVKEQARKIRESEDNG
jgi:radical SAM superfamily enzyme YgiQ (UPF0313 family)